MKIIDYILWSQKVKLEVNVNKNVEAKFQLFGN